LDSKASIIFLS